jgi:uncharacterized protein YkwD
MMSRRALLVMLALALVAMILPARPANGAVSTDRTWVFADTNRIRAEHGRQPLVWGGWLAGIAQRHAARMAYRDTLYHNPDLFTEVSNWSLVAENVGTGPDLLTVQASFMQSTHHRANILDRRLQRAGVGVVVDEGRVWVCVVFKRRAQ